MYYYDRYIGDMPDIMLRGNVNFTNMKYVAMILTKINKEVFGNDLNIIIEKVFGEYKFEYPIPNEYIGGRFYQGINISTRKKTIEYPKDTYILITNIPKFNEYWQFKAHKENSIYSRDPSHFHYALRDIFHNTQDKLKELIENMQADNSDTFGIKGSDYYNKLLLFYNQLYFIGDWLGCKVGIETDYSGEISYDDGTIWKHPPCIKYEEWLKKNGHPSSLRSYRK